MRPVIVSSLIAVCVSLQFLLLLFAMYHSDYLPEVHGKTERSVNEGRVEETRESMSQLTAAVGVSAAGEETGIVRGNRKLCSGESKEYGGNKQDGREKQDGGNKQDGREKQEVGNKQDGREKQDGGNKQGGEKQDGGGDVLKSSATTKSADVDNNDYQNFFSGFPHFLPVPSNDRINTKSFLESAAALLPIFDMLSAVLKPVKADIQGNINKLQKRYEINPEKYVSLLDIIEQEMKNDDDKLLKPSAIEGLLWLKRGLQFIEVMISELVTEYENADDTSGDYLSKDDAGLFPVVKLAYERTLRPHHGWFTQKFVGVFLRAAPTRRTFINAICYGQRDFPRDRLMADTAHFLKTFKDNTDTIHRIYHDKDIDSSELV